VVFGLRDGTGGKEGGICLAFPGRLGFWWRRCGGRLGRVCDELDGHFFGRGSEVGVVELIDWPLWRGEVDWQEGALNVDATGYFDGCNGQDLSQTLTCVHTIPIESMQERLDKPST
jgi:hypothetical protein